MNALRFAVAALAVSAVALTNLNTAAAETTICPGSSLLKVCVVKGSAELTVYPVQPGASIPMGELQEWAMSTGSGSVHLTCFYGSIETCDTLASLGFSYVRTLATVSRPDVDPSPLFCGIGVYSATLTVLVLGNGVEDAPFLTADSTC